MNTILNYMTARFKEPSTYAAVAALVALTGVEIDVATLKAAFEQATALWKSLLSTAASIAAVVAIFTKETHTS